ncbi:MAG: chemotaxis response regulator protein-glutamate methylesterase [Bdellovibrionales bacterium]|nr:chemotaxis response regulator protein-glutamate methylesterase [Bdellovibrionales bacterium]
MEKSGIHALVVDDSALFRKQIERLFYSDAAFEKVSLFSDGNKALNFIKDSKPDVVILDIEMPIMNGLELLKHIRDLDKPLPIIMFSSLTQKGAAVTLEALAYGATDFVGKPSTIDGFSNTPEQVFEALLFKTKTLAKRSSYIKTSLDTHVKKLKNSRVDLIVIGCSTGGPKALETLLSQITNDISAPILIVQHMPPLFTKLLADQLDSKTNLNVKEGADNQFAEPGAVYIAPGGYHMVIDRNYKIYLNQEPMENSCRPAVDVLFRSAAAAFGQNCLGVLLTGMGSDGLKGCHKIKDCSGSVFVQDQESSVIGSMPGAVQSAGLADAVYSLNDIGLQIYNYTLKNSVEKKCI